MISPRRDRLAEADRLEALAHRIRAEEHAHRNPLMARAYLGSAEDCDVSAILNEKAHDRSNPYPPIPEYFTYHYPTRIGCPYCHVMQGRYTGSRPRKEELTVRCRECQHCGKTFEVLPISLEFVAGMNSPILLPFRPVQIE